MAADPLPAPSQIALGALRIVTGLIFLAHGTQKFLFFPAAMDGKAPAGAGWNFDGAGAYAGLIELVAGACITLGLLTRPMAFLASGTMAVAYWYMHAPSNFFPVNNNGDAAILYCFVFLYIFFAGPGAWNLDGLLKRRRREEKDAERAAGR